MRAQNRFLLLQLAPQLDEGTLRIIGVIPYASWENAYTIPCLVVCATPADMDVSYLADARACAEGRYDMHAEHTWGRQHR